MTVRYDAAYFGVIERVEDRHFWFTSRNAIITAALQPVTARLPGRPRLLEVGCGTGNTMRALAAASPDALLVGMDGHPEALAVARRRHAGALVCARAEAPPFRTPFHLIGMFDVLEHIEDDHATLDALRRLLTPGGWLALTVPADQRLWSATDVAAQHVRRYSASLLEEALRGAGYTVEYLTPFMTLLYPAALIGRRLHDWRARGASAATGADRLRQELRVRTGLNGALARLLSQEARWVRRWRTLPIGTSLFAVARVR